MLKCIRYGNHLYQRYQDFHNAEDDIRVRILEIEGHWLQIEEQIKYMQTDLARAA